MDVILLTNRTVQAFDALGDEMLHISRAFSAQPTPENGEIERNAIEEIWDYCGDFMNTKDEVKIYIASVREACWKQEIGLSEFATLLGHGQWFWKELRDEHSGYGG